MKVGAHYTRDELRDAVSFIGISHGDVVLLHVSLGRLGIPAETGPDFPAMSSLLIDVFADAVGPTGTLLVPTYTYSFRRGEMFDVAESPATTGEFCERFRRRPDVIRSRDPMLATAGIGPAAHDILRRISFNCYGEGSTFDRLHECGAKICTIGLGLWWATYCHYIERSAAVPFRFDKSFTGVIREDGRDAAETWTYFAAPHLVNCQSNSIALERRVRQEGLLRLAPVGRGQIAVIGAREFKSFGLNEFQKNPWLTAQGPPCDASELHAAIHADREQHRQ